MDKKVDYEVPVAYCKHCDKAVPVYIKQFDLTGEEFGELNGDTIEVVVCPLCVNVLSFDEDIEVTYYKSEDLQKVVDFKFDGTA